MIGRCRLQIELVAEFLLPLVHERRNREHEEPFHHAAREPFLERETGFDGFAQANFVRQERASAQRADDTQGGTHLVLQPLNPAIRQRDKIVRLVGNPPLRGALPQKEASEIFERKGCFLKGKFGQFDARRHGRQRRALGGFRRFGLGFLVGLQFARGSADGFALRRPGLLLPAPFRSEALHVFSPALFLRHAPGFLPQQTLLVFHKVRLRPSKFSGEARRDKAHQVRHFQNDVLEPGQRRFGTDETAVRRELRVGPDFFPEPRCVRKNSHSQSAGAKTSDATGCERKRRPARNAPFRTLHRRSISRSTPIRSM